MKIITIVLLVAGACLLSGFVLGARSTRPDLTLTAAEELSLIRAEVSLQAAKGPLSTEKDPAKLKALTDARDEKQKAEIAIGGSIRKSHRCEVCIFRWHLETDGSIKLQAPAPIAEKK